LEGARRGPARRRQGERRGGAAARRRRRRPAPRRRDRRRPRQPREDRLAAWGRQSGARRTACFGGGRDGKGSRVSSIDTAEFRGLLEQERRRIVDTIAHLHEENPRNIEDELGELAGRGSDNHLGGMATVTFDRELDEGLEEGAQQTLAQIDRALARL